MMEYQSFDPVPWGFPKPLVELLPTIGHNSLGLRREQPTLALSDAPNARFYTRGRYAMMHAYQLCGVGPGTSLLAPAYHCRTMLDPAIRLGATVLLYSLTNNLKPDLDHLRDCLENSTSPVSALLVTHYFGFAHALTEILNLCRSFRVDLIEDCSHCLFLPSANNDLGRQGRYCVSSPYKFFPIEEGGILWANRDNDLPAKKLQAQGFVPELKGLARTIERAVARAPVPARESPGLAAKLRHAGSTVATSDSDRRQTFNGHSSQYDPACENLSGLAVAKWVMHHARLTSLVAQRRSNYAAWLQCATQLPDCYPLYPYLPDETVPYMFALVIGRPAVHFFALKRLGMPVWRWDDMAVSNCTVSMKYRTHVVHLPCHQELTAAQMHWMTSTVTKVMTMPTANMDVT